MCGIAGSLRWEKPNRDEFKNLKKIISFLNHRGPNFSEVKKIDNVIFGHTRLAIIDLDKSANQPMSDVSGRYFIVYNGEIYNSPKLKFYRNSWMQIYQLFFQLILFETLILNHNI